MTWSLIVNFLPGEGGKCGPPPVIENGDLLSFPMQEYSPGTTLEYKCPSLYLLEGSQYITCTDGQWTSPPVCLGRLKLWGQRLCDCSAFLLLKILRALLVQQHMCQGVMVARRNFVLRLASVVPSAACCLSLGSGGEELVRTHFCECSQVLLSWGHCSGQWLWAGRVGVSAWWCWEILGCIRDMGGRKHI